MALEARGLGPISINVRITAVWLRNRARDLVRNNPYASKALSELVGNQIGTGIMPRANTGDEKLNSLIDEKFAAWAQNCDADGQLDFFGIQWQVARAVLQAGAEPDALADMYGAECTTMTMLVSSSHPATAGLQVPLIELLLDFGATIEGRGTRKWGGPLFTALAFGMSEAAKVLAKCGARIDLSTAAGLGLADVAALLLSSADTESRHRALSLAAQHGYAEIVRLLLDAGEDPNRYNLEGNHAHSTPRHQAVLEGRETVVRLLVEHGARLDIRDTIWQGTPLGWALYGGGKAQPEMAECLRSFGAAE
jgi:ankyrin repeat protein